MTMLADIWNAINAEESFLPLIISLSIWTVAFLYSHLRRRKTFHDWDFIHNIHNLGAMVLASFSLYYKNDSVFRERIQVLYNIGYFLVDISDCLWRGDRVYTFHAAITLIGGYYCIASSYAPVIMETRVASRLCYCELSNPLRYLAVKTKKPLHSALFFVVFTLVRIVYIPTLIWILLQHGLQYSDGPVVIYGVVYALQVYWWFKMWKIVIKMVRGKDVKHEIKEEYQKDE